MSKKVLTVTAVIAAVLIVAGMALSFSGTKSESAVKKNLEISVIANDVRKVYHIETEHKYLGDALAEKDIIKGEKSQYGLFITEVAGIKADEKKEEWWLVTKNGEGTTTGVSSIEIADGECYELTLKVGYSE